MLVSRVSAASVGGFEASFLAASVLTGVGSLVPAVVFASVAVLVAIAGAAVADVEAAAVDDAVSAASEGGLSDCGRGRRGILARPFFSR